MTAREHAVRQMYADDLDEVMRNEVRAYDHPWTRGVFLDCLRGGYECWVITDAMGILGHGVLSCVAGEAHLLNVCVAVEHQGKGLGRMLVDHLVHRSRIRAAEVVFLEVRISNTVASALYESVGFNEIGRRRNYYPAANGHEDARVLALQLELPGQSQQ
jgi:ribosomal-protein-alanine N-acetyltransferase